MFLPDVNLWLALTFDSHINHPDAKNWFNGLSEQICFFCRMTQQQSFSPHVWNDAYLAAFALRAGLESALFCLKCRVVPEAAGSFRGIKWRNNRQVRNTRRIV